MERSRRELHVKHDRSTGDYVLERPGGGRQMEVTENKTATLRAQEHGHQPIIACGFDGNAGARSGSVGFAFDGGGGTLEAGKVKHVLVIKGQSGHCAQEITKE